MTKKRQTEKDKLDEIITFKAYKKKELCTPDALTYQAVQYRIRKGKNIKILFEQGVKNKRQREMFLNSEVSARIKKALEILEKIEKWEIEIKDIKSK